MNSQGELTMRKIIISATLIFPLLAGAAIAAPSYGKPGYDQPTYGAVAAPTYGWPGTMSEECSGAALDWGHCLYDNSLDARDDSDRAGHESGNHGGKGGHR
jgi:hypothetical protein